MVLSPSLELSLSIHLLLLASSFCLLINILFSSAKCYNGQSNSDQVAIQVSAWTEPQVIMMPVSKGDQIYCYYNFGGETIKFEFRYAEGDQ